MVKSIHNSITIIGIAYVMLYLGGMISIAHAKSPFIASSPKTHTEKILSSSHEYTINLGGSVDMDNTTSRGYGGYEVAFQPNISLEIENIGTTSVIDPWIIANGVRDWRTIDSMVNEIIRKAGNDQEKLMLIYEFARSNRYHNYPLYEEIDVPGFDNNIGDELHDPVKHFNIYNAGFCDDIGRVTCALAYRAGFTKELQGKDPVIRLMHGHVMSEVAVNGRCQFIDTDQNAFYLDPENEFPVSGDDIVRDADLVNRDYTYGPFFHSWQGREKASAVIGRDDYHERSIDIGYEMHLTLRPGEKLVLRWDNIGKLPGKSEKKMERYAGKGAYYANSFIEWVPVFDSTIQKYTSDWENSRAGNGMLIGKDSLSSVIFPIETPWVVCGGSVKANVQSDGDDNEICVGVSVDGKHWKNVWQAQGRGTFNCDVAIDDSIEVNGSVPIYRYFIRFTSDSKGGALRLSGLKLHTDLLTSPLSLPRLSLGENRLRYSDTTTGPHQVRVTHTFQESVNIKPPLPPKLTEPGNGVVSRDAWVRFSWGGVPDADKYHLRVSKRKDLLTSYRPCYDVIVDSTSYANQRTGLFNSDETYYWSVQARNKEGVWGSWSPVQTFSWDGPKPPVNLAILSRNGKIFLTWKQNPRGNPPVKYEVYASDISGFPPMKVPFTMESLGEVPPTFITETTQTEFLVVSPDPNDPAPNKSFYRVIAVDEFGTPGGSSWPIELNHPYIYSIPAGEAKVGEPYTYQVQTLQSLGNLQYRYQSPSLAFWEKEGYEYFLAQAPAWLTLDPKTGIMTGNPKNTDIGEEQVTVIVTRTWPNEVKATDERHLNFRKDKPQYQASDKQSFAIKVIP